MINSKACMGSFHHPKYYYISTQTNMKDVSITKHLNKTETLLISQY